MSVKIYEMAHSPYCIPITRALTALGITFERIPVPNWDRRAVIEITEGAYYQVPVLVHEDQIIYESGDESLDVAEYVDSVFAGGRLFPESLAGVHEVLVQYLEEDLEGLTFKLCDVHYLPSITDPVARAMVRRHKERRFGRGCVDAWAANESAYREQIDGILSRFDRGLRHRDFLLDAESPVYADYALLGVIENLCFGGHQALAPEHEALIRWRERLLAFRFPA
jgi:glutathione S-transferase